MIDPYEFLSELKIKDVNFITGVPDSLLKNFIKAIDDSFLSENHVIAANEGNAIALAAGHYISTNCPSIVYLQNSGLGNAINPLVSLTDDKVYSIPMMLMIGWRGEPGTKDEPQHLKQGQITEELLDILTIPYFKINSFTKIAEVLNIAFDKMNEINSPVALLVSQDTFETVKFEIEKNDLKLISREQAIEEILSLLPLNSLVISTTGMASREVFEIREKKLQNHDQDFLTVGSMGHASSIALMIAKNLPSRLVVCIDGDGSVIMHMGSLGVIGQSNSKNFLHILLNNGSHDSVGGQPTVGHKVDFQSIAASSGYLNSCFTNDIDTLKTEINRLKILSGPNFLEVQVKKGARNDLGRPNLSPKENLVNFMRNIHNANV
jgi:phosphonopyruvate decarboxylase